MSGIRLLIVDDQVLFREGLRTLLSVREEVEVVGEASNGREAIDLIATRRPAVVLMDLRMPELDGVAATRIIRERYSEVRVIILTTFDDDDLVFEGLRGGAVGYLLKDSPTDRLIEAIEAAARGDSFLQPSIAAKVVAEFSRLSAPLTHALVEPLSDRELDVLRQLVRGASNKEIAFRLNITEGTVKNHMTNIFGKLEVGDRTQAALKARELNLV